jgi:predicted RNA binding protein YcfA (HicA-like mRNA interferase family)
VAERAAIWRRLARRPSSVRFSEIQQLLEACNWRLDRIRGSHHIFVRNGEAFTVPYRRPYILPVYVREVLRRTAEVNEDA